MLFVPPQAKCHQNTFKRKSQGKHVLSTAERSCWMAATRALRGFPQNSRNREPTWHSRPLMSSQEIIISNLHGTAGFYWKWILTSAAFLLGRGQGTIQAGHTSVASCWMCGYWPHASLWSDPKRLGRSFYRLSYLSPLWSHWALLATVTSPTFP